MKRRGGYVLLGLLLFFTVLGLSGTVAVLEQDTRLIRLSEEELKLNLNALRRGIDLFRFHYPNRNDPTRRQLENHLENASTSAGIESLTDFLVEKSFIRQRAAIVKVDRHKTQIKWQVINNLLTNSSFEIDDGQPDVAKTVGTWRGNHTANDGVPDGWQLNSTGAEQKIKIGESGNYVISFWARSENAAAGAALTVKVDDVVVFNLIANSTEWKRYFRSFPEPPNTVPASSVVSIILSPNSGTTYFDGLMLERWKGIEGTVMTPSAWTDNYQIVPTATDSALQERSFKTELLPDPGITNIATYSHRWFQW